jgi:hypothetical protein
LKLTTFLNLVPKWRIWYLGLYFFAPIHFHIMVLRHKGNFINFIQKRYCCSHSCSSFSSYTHVIRSLNLSLSQTSGMVHVLFYCW